MTRLLFVVFCAFLCTCFSEVASTQGAFFLTGAQIYRSDKDGVSGDSYRYITNSTDIDLGAYRLGIQRQNEAGTRQDRAISFSLSTGINYFDFNTTQSEALASNYIGINLFFNDTGESFNPPNVLGNKIAGHISAVVEIGSNGTFKIVNANTLVQSYDYRGNSTAAANGNESFALGDNMVTLTSLSASGGSLPSGTFGLTVTATPEPATLGLAALAGIGLIEATRRRLRRKNSQTR